MDQASLKALVDAMFAFLESRTSQPLVKMIEQMADTTIDAEIPALLTYLQGKGVLPKS